MLTNCLAALPLPSRLLLQEEAGEPEMDALLLGRGDTMERVFMAGDLGSVASLPLAVAATAGLRPSSSLARAMNSTGMSRMASRR